METPSAFLIDLDDTLYSERSFINTGYECVADFISGQSNLSAEDVYARLTYEHQKYGRAKVLNRVCEYFSIEDIPIKDIVAAYRAASSPLTLFPGVKAALAALASIAPLAIVTDGATEIQKKKVSRLDVEGLVSEVVYSWETGKPKPSPFSFTEAAKRLGVDPKKAIIVGDDPYHDGAAAMAAGCKFVRVRTGKYKDIELSSCATYMDIERFSKLRHKFHETH